LTYLTFIVPECCAWSQVWYFCFVCLCSESCVVWVSWVGPGIKQWCSCCPIICLYVLISLLWCSLWFPYKNVIRHVFIPIFL